jgi:hypothetical protein
LLDTNTTFPSFPATAAVLVNSSLKNDTMA